MGVAAAGGPGETRPADAPGGDSAGVNLVIAVSARLAGRAGIVGLVLIYPVVAADFSTPSYERFATGLPLLKADMEWFFRHYATASQWGDPAITPLHASVADRRPPAVIALAEHDFLHDEGRAYATRLARAGRDVTLRPYPGVPHGFVRLHNLVDTADRAVTELAADMRGFCTR